MPRNFSIRFSSVVVFFLFASTACVSAYDITAVIKTPSLIYRIDAASGAYKGSIQVNNAISVGCDGKTIAVLLGSGSVSRYDAQNGAYRGSIQVGKDAQSVQVSDGVIAVRTNNQLKRYKADSGSYVGTTQL
jgi:hypothetical protein